MPREEENLRHLVSMPTEIVLYIFTYLPARDLTKCRQVCQRWRYLIDGLQNIDSLWKKHCVKDHEKTYKVARFNARAGLRWYHVYKSLTLWPQLSAATESADEFAFASNLSEEIMDVKILHNSIIGVHKKGAIVYYNIETQDRAKRQPITGNYLKYTENADVILILSFQLHLHILRKVVYNSRLEPNASFDDVKTFLLTDHEVYYVTLNEDIFVVDMRNDNIACRYLGNCQSGVMNLSYTNNILYLLTFEKNILSYINCKLQIVCELNDSTKMLSILRQYNLLDGLDWRVYFQWMFIMNRTIPQGPLRDIVVIRSYGDMMFVGSNWGVLRIYHAPLNDEELDLHTLEPIKQYNFMERQDCPVLSDLCPIVQIDILESKLGHTVIAAMPKKIAIIDFAHHSKKSELFAIMPYKDIFTSNMTRLDRFM